jgi:carboxyl-terminal processing protease
MFTRPTYRRTNFLLTFGLIAGFVCLVQSSVIFAQNAERPALRFTPPVLSSVNESNSNTASTPDSEKHSETFSKNLFRLPSEYPTQGQDHSSAATGNTNLVPLQDAAPLLQANLLPANSLNLDELNQVLQHGIELESESRWMDVLNHYETALQIYRNDDRLLDRYRVARFHYDVGRRYHDTSYLDIIQKSGFIDTLNFFERIVTCIQDDYIDAPNWDRLFRYGTQNFDIALSDSGFRTRVRLNVAPEKIGTYLNTMRNTANSWEIRNREDLKNGILRLAEIAQQQIGLNPAVTLMEYTCGMVNSLDRYTTYLTPNQLTEQFSLISGNLVGLGVELRSDHESLLIVRVIQGSPAQEGGLKDGDRILAVDGISTKGRDTDSAADLLQGSEGSVVRLLMKTGLNSAREIQITRRQIDVPSVEDVRMLNDSLGYVKLTGFQSKTAEEMKTALTELDRQGMRCLVLDMRRNPGGLLQVGIEVANLFLDNGAIVRIRGRHNNSDHTYMATQNNTWKVPLIVLIDEESASASEIVAEAIRDHKRGVIIGKRSYGKGTIQQILPLHSGMAGNARVGLKLTIEKFYSPVGWSCSGVGVSPDIVVETEKRWNVARLVDGKLQIPVTMRSVSSDTNDPFIRQAIETAQKMILSTAQRN